MHHAEQCVSILCLSMLLRPPSPTLFPYTTLFRSDLTDWTGQTTHDEFARLLESIGALVTPHSNAKVPDAPRDRKSTRLNSSHLGISYAVFCLKKKNWSNH